MLGLTCTLTSTQGRLAKAPARGRPAAKVGVRQLGAAALALACLRASSWQPGPRRPAPLPTPRPNLPLTKPASTALPAGPAALDTSLCATQRRRRPAAADGKSPQARAPLPGAAVPRSGRVLPAHHRRGKAQAWVAALRALAAARVLPRQRTSKAVLDSLPCAALPCCATHSLRSCHLPVLPLALRLGGRGLCRTLVLMPGRKPQLYRSLRSCLPAHSRGPCSRQLAARLGLAKKLAAHRLLHCRAARCPPLTRMATAWRTSSLWAPAAQPAAGGRGGGWAGVAFMWGRGRAAA